LRKVILFSGRALWSIFVDVYRSRLEGRNGSVGPDPVCDVRIRSQFFCCLLRDATDPWDRIRSRFYLFPIKEGVIFWTRGSGSGLECHKYYFFSYGADWVQTLVESVRRSIDSTGWLMGKLYLGNDCGTYKTYLSKIMVGYRAKTHS